MMKFLWKKGESSNTKPKRKWDEYSSSQNSWDTYENETMSRKGYVRANEKRTKVKEEFKPHYKEIWLENY